MELEKVQSFQNTDTMTDWMCYRGSQHIPGNCFGHMLVGCTCLSNYNGILWNSIKESCYQLLVHSIGLDNVLCFRWRFFFSLWHFYLWRVILGDFKNSHTPMTNSKAELHWEIIQKLNSAIQDPKTPLSWSRSIADQKKNNNKKSQFYSGIM